MNTTGPLHRNLDRLIARVTAGFLASTKENRTPALRQAPTTGLLP
jgi:hypothetical protein